MGTLFRTFLSTLIKRGHLEVETADGITQIFGDRTGPKLAVKLNDRAAERELVFDPTLALGELYMDGRLVVTKGDLYDVLAMGEQNIVDFGGPRWLKLLEDARIATRRFRQRNDRFRAQRNIAHHYDLNVKLYDLFLDADRQYSCAYFERPGATLEEAQLAKKRHIAAKMLVDDGHSVLDIGCGFGGMGLYLANTAGARATGVTLSKEQHAVATKRAIDGGLADRVSFRLEGLPRRRPKSSTASFRSACSNMSASAASTNISSMSRAC
jgi:cyclopropane-fatty-acyl-phospholipid synthase